MKKNFDFSKKGNTVAVICIMVAFIALIAVAVVALLPKAVPVPTDTVKVTVDEPGVVLTLNPEDYSVIGAETVSAEDRHFSYDLAGSLPFKQSASMLIKSLVEANVISGVSNESVLLAVEAGSVKDFEAVCAYFKEAMAENNCTAKLYTLHINEKLSSINDIATQYGSSYAKAMLCNKLSKELDMKVEDLITKTVSEILNISKNTTGNDGVVSDIIDNVNSDAAKDDQKNNSSGSSSSASSSETSSEGTSSEGTSSGNTSSNVSSSETSSGTSSSESSSGTSSSESSSGSSSSGSSSSNSSSSGISFTQDPDDDGWFPHM